MPLGQRRIERERAAAVFFCPAQPRALRVETKVHVHRDEGQRGVREREVRIVFDGGGEMRRRAPQSHFRVAGALPEARHEFVVRLRVLAVPVPCSRHRRGEAPVQRVEHTAPDLVLDLEHAVAQEVVLFRHHDPVRRCVEQLDRDPPL
jgi:hypothetical protein